MMTDQTPLPPDMEVFYSDDPPGPRSRRLRILAAITLVALVAGAGVGFIFAGHSSTSPTASRSAPVATSPYALNNDPAPSLAGAYSDNLLVAFRALYAYHNWVFNHPSASLVDRYVANGSPAYSVERSNVEYLVTLGAHTPNDPRGYDGDIQYARVSLVPTALTDGSDHPLYRDGHRAFSSGLITVVVRYLADNLYSATGSYIQPGQRAGVAAISYSMFQSADGQWRLYQGTILNPPGGPLSVEQ